MSANMHHYGDPMTTSMVAPTGQDSAHGIAVDLRVLALEAQAAPAVLGGTYARLLASTINDSGDVALAASLAGSAASSAIVLISGDSARPIVRSGEQAPGGGRYRAFGELD